VLNRSARILAALENADAAAEKMAALGCVSFTQTHARTNSARKAGFDGSNDLKTEGIRLRAACYIVIDLFSGIRDSEMMSLAEHCISTGRSMDGSTDVQWLHGTIYKTGLRTKKWLVPPVVREAIDVLTRLTAPLREKLRQEERKLEVRIGLSIAKEKARLIKRLYTVREHKDKLFLAKSASIADCEIAVLSGATMRQDLKRFCVNLGILGEDGQPYPLHPHQFRRTYARFMARSELGDLLTLRDHFGHWSIDMTVYYTDGGADDFESDTELLEMVTTEKLSRQNEIMGSYLNSDTPLANGTDWLNSWRSSVRTALNKEALIAEYAGTITLNGTGHSWCVGNAKGTGCGGLCVFEAQMCVDCNYGIIGQEHRPAWEGIRDQQKEALGLDDIGPGGRARARQILSYAERYCGVWTVRR
jgi:integrase